MFCGSIPIYLGPQDIDAYLPEGTYIDLRLIDSVEELVAFLNGLTETDIEWYRNNIRKFVTSKKAIDMFSSVGLAYKIIEILEDNNVI